MDDVTTSDARVGAALSNESPVVHADGMRIIWDAPIPMSDGVVLRADIFMPEAPGEYAAIISYGAYGKGVPMQVGYKSAYDRMVKAYPEVAEGSTNKYMNWEVVDPEKWVPDGFICIRVDSRGAGRSPGVLDATSVQETKDIYECIEWAAAQGWSNGKVGMNGISYYATNQLKVAALRPPHLAAICVWEGFVDAYRDASRHGGILSEFGAGWFGRQVLKIQHGYGDRGGRNPNNGELISGPETLSDEELAANRAVPMTDPVLHHPLDDEFYAPMKPDVSRIEIPMLSAANWGGMGVHPRGNFEAYMGAGSKQKWLEVHGDTHFSPFYRAEGLALQKRFLGHFLQGKDTGWDRQPPVQLQIRRPGEHFTIRDEHEWPLARTQWTKYYLDPAARELTTTPTTGASVSYSTTDDGITFTLPPAQEDLEITGPLAARLTVSSQTVDADLFLALRLFAPDGKEVLFIGSNDPRVPIALGWLRASHRKLDETRSLPYRPYHAHDELQPLTPGEPVVLDIEILPTSIVVPAGYTLALNIRGCDYDHGLGDAGFSNQPYPMTGVGPFRHADVRDRPPEIFGGENKLHFEAGQEPFLLLPVIPAKAA